MARAYSQDLRDRVLAAAADGGSSRGAAARFGIGIKTAIEWVRRARDTGETSARKQGQPPGSKLDPHEVFLLGLVDGKADITLSEMKEQLAAQHGVSASVTTLWRFFDARGLTFKKRAPTPPSRSARTS